MLNKIITFSIKNKLIIGLFIFGLIGYGSYQFTKLPIDAVPDITDNQVQVITVTPSWGAPDVERLITFPIEQANSNMPGLKEMRSFSRLKAAGSSAELIVKAGGGHPWLTLPEEVEVMAKWFHKQLVKPVVPAAN